MSEHVSGSQIDSHVRLAAEPPDQELLRRYFQESDGATDTDRLTEAEKRWVATNIELNPTWQKAWSTIVEASSRKTSHFRRDHRSSHRRKRLLMASLAGAISLYGVLWIGGRAFLPDTYPLASIKEHENHLDRQTRSTVTESQTRFAAASRAMLTANESTFGLFPGYDREKTRQAIKDLTRAFEMSSDPFERAEVAFFLAKAHLMESDALSARIWLQRVEAQQVADYRAEAAELLAELETGE